MSDQFVGEIRMFPFDFAPPGWAFCSGQIIPLSQNTALFAILGTTYGGDGKSTFALPDLQGSAALHAGQGAGLSLRDLGEVMGTETITLLESEIPVHDHDVRASTEPGDNSVPSPSVVLTTSTGAFAYVAVVGATAPMAPTAIGNSGGGLPHSNMMPYLTLNFCIALQGIFPERW
jgi:microcystin-dependent protein